MLSLLFLMAEQEEWELYHKLIPQPIHNLGEEARNIKI